MAFIVKWDSVMPCQLLKRYWRVLETNWAAVQALSDLLLNCFKWHLLSNEPASLTVLSGIYRQMRQCYAYCITVLSAVWTEEYLECSSGQLLKRYLESLRSVRTLESLEKNKLRRGCARFHVYKTLEKQSRTTWKEKWIKIERKLKVSAAPGKRKNSFTLLDFSVRVGYPC